MAQDTQNKPLLGNEARMFLKGVGRQLVPGLETTQFTEDDYSQDYLDALSIVADHYYGADGAKNREAFLEKNLADRAKNFPDVPPDDLEKELSTREARYRKKFEGKGVDYNMVNTLFGEGSIFKSGYKIDSPADEIKTTLGEFSLERDGDTWVINDRYDFSDTSSLGQAISDSKEGEGLMGKAYPLARWIGGKVLQENPDGSSPEDSPVVTIRVPAAPLQVETPVPMPRPDFRSEPEPEPEPEGTVLVGKPTPSEEPKLEDKSEPIEDATPVAAPAEVEQRELPPIPEPEGTKLVGRPTSAAEAELQDKPEPEPEIPEPKAAEVERPEIEPENISVAKPKLSLKPMGELSFSEEIKKADIPAMETVEVEIDDTPVFAAKIPGEGTIISKDKRIVNEVVKSQADDTSLSIALGYSDKKPADSDRVVRVFDDKKRVISEEATNNEGTAAAKIAAERIKPENGNVDVVSTEQGLIERRQRFQTGQPSNPYIGAMRGAGKPVTTYQDAFGSFTPSQINPAAPRNLKEAASRGFYSGTESTIAMGNYFLAIGNAVLGDEEGVEMRMERARHAEARSAIPWSNMAGFEQFLEEPDFGKFLEMSAAYVGVMAPSAVSSLAAALAGGLVGGYAGMAGAAGAVGLGAAGVKAGGGELLKRSVREIIQRKLKGEVLDEAEEAVLQAGYRGLRRGAIVGAFGSEFPMMSGAVAGQFEKAGKEFGRTEALISAGVGVPAAAVGVLSEKFIAENIVKMFMKKGAGQSSSVYTRYAKRVGTAFGLGAAAEGSAEGIQESMISGVRKAIDPSFTNEEYLMNIAEGTFAGAVGGGTFAGGGALTAQTFQEARAMVDKGMGMAANMQAAQEDTGILRLTGPTRLLTGPTQESDNDIRGQANAVVVGNKPAMWIPESQSIADTVTVYDAAGNPFEATVVERSENGGVLVIDQSGQQVVLNMGPTAQSVNVRDPQYELETAGANVQGQKVQDIDDLDGAESAVAGVLEKARGSGQGAELNAIMDINAIRTERKRRSGDPSIKDMRLSDETVGDDAESISAEGEVLADSSDIRGNFDMFDISYGNEIEADQLTQTVATYAPATADSNREADFEDRFEELMRIVDDDEVRQNYEANKDRLSDSAVNFLLKEARAENKRAAAAANVKNVYEEEGYEPSRLIVDVRRGDEGTIAAGQEVLFIQREMTDRDLRTINGKTLPAFLEDTLNRILKDGEEFKGSTKFEIVNRADGVVSPITLDGVIDAGKLINVRFSENAQGAALSKFSAAKAGLLRGISELNLIGYDFLVSGQPMTLGPADIKRAGPGAVAHRKDKITFARLINTKLPSLVDDSPEAIMQNKAERDRELAIVAAMAEDPPNQFAVEAAESRFDRARDKIIARERTLGPESSVRRTKIKERGQLKEVVESTDPAILDPGKPETVGTTMIIVVRDKTTNKMLSRQVIDNANRKSPAFKTALSKARRERVKGTKITYGMKSKEGTRTPTFSGESYLQSRIQPFIVIRSDDVLLRAFLVHPAITDLNVRDTAAQFARDWAAANPEKPRPRITYEELRQDSITQIPSVAESMEGNSEQMAREAAVQAGIANVGGIESSSEVPLTPFLIKYGQKPGANATPSRGRRASRRARKEMDLAQKQARLDTETPAVPPVMGNLGPLTRAVLNKAHELFKFKQKIRIITVKQIQEGQFIGRREAEPFRDALLQAVEDMKGRDSNVQARTITIDNVSVIVVKDQPKASYGKTDDAKRAAVLAHELGHVLFKEEFNKIVNNRSLKNALWAEYKKDVQKIIDEGGDVGQYKVPGSDEDFFTKDGFEEWYADQVASYVYSKASARKDETQAEKKERQRKGREEKVAENHFKKVARLLREFAKKVNEVLGLRLTPNAFFRKYMDNVAEAHRTHVDDQKIMSGGEHVSLDGQIQIDNFIEGLNNKIPKAALDQLEKASEAFYRTRFGEVFNRVINAVETTLSNMEGGKSLSKFFYGKSQSYDQMGYHMAYESQNKRFVNRVGDILGLDLQIDRNWDTSSVEKILLQAENEDIATSDLKSLRARNIRKFLSNDVFDNYIQDPKNGKVYIQIPIRGGGKRDIRKRRNFFPRSLNENTLMTGDGPNARNLVDVLTQDYTFEVDGITYDSKNWRMSVPEATKLADDLIVKVLFEHPDVRKEEPDGTASPGMSSALGRKLDKVPTAALRHAGLLHPPQSAIIQYIHHVTRKVEFEKRGGSKEVDRRINLMANEKDRDWARASVDAMLGRVDAQLHPWVRRFNSVESVHSIFTTLLFAVFSSLPDLAAIAIRSKEFGNLNLMFNEIYNDFNTRLIIVTDGSGNEISRTVVAREDVKEALQKAYDSVPDGGRVLESTEAMELARAVGTVSFEGLDTVFVSVGELDFGETWSRQYLEKFFEVTQLQRWTRYTRIIATGVGREFIKNTARHSPNQRDARYLTELGLTREEVLEWIEAGEGFESAVGQKVRDAIVRFSEEAIIRPNAAERPLWASSPYLQFVWRLKSYPYSYGNVVLGGMGREIMNRYSEDGNFNAGAQLVAMSLAMALPLAMMGWVFREKSKEAGRFIVPDFILPEKGGLARYEYMDGLGLMAELVDRGGLLGRWSIALQTAESFKYEGIMAPITSNVPVYDAFDDSFFDGDRYRLFPVLNNIQ